MLQRVNVEQGGLPQDSEAEASCLAAALLSRDALLRVLDILHEDDFYLPSHRIIFNSIRDLDKKSKPIDLLTLKQHLVDSGNFDRAGGNNYLAELYRMVATSANAEAYAKRIKELSLRRTLIAISAQSAEKCQDMSRETSEVLDEIERDIFRVTERRITSEMENMESIVEETMKQISLLQKHKRLVTGIASGFTRLDVLLTGFHESELIILAARPAMGKTALALNILNNVGLKQQKTSLFFSLEMPATQLLMRMLCIDSQVEAQRLRTGHLSPEEYNKINNSARRFSGAPIYIDDSPGLLISDIRAKARRIAQKEQLGLVMIDYLQLISSNSRADRQQQISEISRGLKLLARELNCPIIALSQLSRAVESRTDQRPQLSDLRESGAIEQDADVVMFIYREEKVKPDTEKKGIAEIIVAKQRNGPIDNIELLFWDKYTKFANIDTIHTYDEATPDHI